MEARKLDACCDALRHLLDLSGSLAAADRPDLAIVEKVGGSVSFYMMDGREVGRVKWGLPARSGALGGRPAAVRE